MKTLLEVKESVVKSIVGKHVSWDDVLRAYDYGMGISKLISYSDLMDRVAEEYKNQFILKRDLINLRKSIHSADETGEELLIKDLATQCDSILGKLGIAYKVKYVSPFNSMTKPVRKK